MILCEGVGSGVASLAFEPRGSLLAGTLDGRLLRYAGAGASPQVLHTFPATAEDKPCWINALAIERDGKHVIAAHADGWTYFESHPGRLREIYHCRALPASAAMFINDRLAIIGLGDRHRDSSGRLELWNCAGPFRRLSPHFAVRNGVRAAALHASSDQVAWANGHRVISVWNYRTQQPRDLPFMHLCHALAWSACGERLAAALDRAVMIIDPATGDVRTTMNGHTGRVTAVGFHPNGRILFSASWDQTLRLWDAASGAIREVRHAAIGNIFAMALAADGMTLAIAGEQGHIAIWDLE